MMTAMKRKPTLTRARILKVLREHEDLLRRYSVKRLGLFGSYPIAAQDPRQHSDEPRRGAFLALRLGASHLSS